MQDLNPGSQTPNPQQTECSLTNRLSYRGSSKNLNSTAHPYDQRAFSPLDPTVSWLSHLALTIYIFAVVNFDALAQASDIQIERRQIVFLCWKQDLNPGSQTPNRQQTECSLTNRLSYRGSTKNLNSTARLSKDVDYGLHWTVFYGGHTICVRILEFKYYDDVIKWKHFRVTGSLCGKFTVPGDFPAQRPVTRSFDVFFDLRPNKRLNKQPWGWWFETPSWSLWRQCNDCTLIGVIRWYTLHS